MTEILSKRSLTLNTHCAPDKRLNVHKFSFKISAVKKANILKAITGKIKTGMHLMIIMVNLLSFLLVIQRAFRVWL